MSYLNKHLSPDEKIIYWCRISRLAFFREYALLVFLLIISITSLFTTFISRIQNYIVLATAMIVLFYMFLILALVLLVRVEYRIWSKRYALTTERVIVSEGIFSEKFRSTTYDKITDLRLNQSVFDKVLNIGTIGIDTAGTDAIEIKFIGVKNPSYIQNKISEMQSAKKPVVEEAAGKEPGKKPKRSKNKR